MCVADRPLVSGTTPVWPDGTCPEDPARQARGCFEIIATALTKADAEMRNVVRTRMFLTSALVPKKLTEELFSDSKIRKARWIAQETPCPPQIDALYRQVVAALGT